MTNTFGNNLLALLGVPKADVLNDTSGELPFKHVVTNGKFRVHNPSKSSEAAETPDRRASREGLCTENAEHINK